MSKFDIGSSVWKQRAHLDNMRAFQWRKIATKRKELLMEVMKAYHEGIESPLEFNEWLRAMDKVYGWELSEELANE